MNNPSEDAHKQRMQKRKALVDARIAEATEERGVLIVMKGNGKGKSSSAFGTLLRAVGHGQRGGVVQFTKGKVDTGEYLFFKDHPRVDFHVMGHGFTWETQNREADTATAMEAWQVAARMLADASLNMVVLDEISYAIKYGYLPVALVVEALKQRPRHMSVFVTGRSCAREILDIADTISVIDDERHAFRLGVKAQAGIEW